MIETMNTIITNQDTTSKTINIDEYLRASDILEQDIKQRMHRILANRLDLSSTAHAITFLGKASDLQLTRNQRREFRCNCDACNAMKAKHPTMSRNKQHDEDKQLVGTYPLEVIWIDDMTKTDDPGPLRMKHFFIIVDDYTDYCWGIE